MYIQQLFSLLRLKYRIKKQYDEAINDINEFIRLEPANFLGYFFRGMKYKEQGQMDQAIQDFAEAVILDPTDEFAQEKLQECCNYFNLYSLMIQNYYLVFYFIINRNYPLTTHLITIELFGNFSF